MKRINVCVCVLGLGLAGMASAQPPSEQQQQQPSDQQQGMQDHDQGMQGGQSSMLQAQKTTATATVMKVDKANRQLTLKTDDGKTLTVSVPAGVKRLNEIKAGDHINVDYYEAIALSLNKPGMKGGEETRVMRGAGKLPNGMIAKKITGMVTVVNVDTSGNMLTVRRPNGEMATIHVTDPQLQKQLSDIHEGDKIRATYTQAAVVTVTREGGGSAGMGSSSGGSAGEGSSGGSGSGSQGM